MLKICSLQHENRCQNCKTLTAYFEDLKNLATNADLCNTNEREVLP